MGNAEMEKETQDAIVALFKEISKNTDKITPRSAQRFFSTPEDKYSIKMFKMLDPSKKKEITIEDMFKYYQDCMRKGCSDKDVKQNVENIRSKKKWFNLKVPGDANDLRGSSSLTSSSLSNSKVNTILKK